MTGGNRSSPVPEVRNPPSGVRHDLRHQLATLQTLFSVGVDDPSSGPQEVRDLVATARSEVGYAMDLLDALPAPVAAIPVPRRGQRRALPTSPPPAPAERCEVDGVLRAAAKAVAPSGRTITVDAVTRLHVEMPRTVLMRIVRNLLGNAVAATGPDGAVLLQAMGTGASRERPGRDVTSSHVRVEIHDDGPGPGRARFHRSGGVGLDVVRSLVLPAGGWLVLGRSPYGGVCAAVTLPTVRGS